MTPDQWARLPDWLRRELREQEARIITAEVRLRRRHAQLAARSERLAVLESKRRRKRRQPASVTGSTLIEARRIWDALPREPHHITASRIVEWL